VPDCLGIFIAGMTGRWDNASGHGSLRQANPTTLKKQLMKLPSFTLAAALALAVTACDKKPAVSSSAESSAPATASAPAAPAVDPKVAFTTALDQLADEVDTITKEGKAGNPMDIMKKIPAVMAKLESVPTAGLPAEVVTAFGKVVKDAKAKTDILAKFPADLPSDPAAIPAYMQANPDAMKAMMEAQSQMGAMEVESKAVEAEFKAAAEKNGMDVTKFINAGQG